MKKKSKKINTKNWSPIEKKAKKALDDFWGVVLELTKTGHMNLSLAMMKDMQEKIEEVLPQAIMAAMLTDFKESMKSKQ